MLLSLVSHVQSLWAGVRQRFEDETGAVGTEYALLLFLIAIVFTVGAVALGLAINDKLQAGADCLNTVVPAAC
jgi:Flp pilus assembly pilin Flp